MSVSRDVEPPAAPTRLAVIQPGITTKPIDVRVLWTVPGSPHPRTTIVKTQAASLESAFALAAYRWRSHANAPAEAELKAIKL